MKCRSFVWAAAVLCAVMVPGTIFGQVIAMQDFEAPLPGPQGFPGGYSFYGDGDGNPGADLVVTEEITDLVAASGIQSFQIANDTSLVNSWWYYGMGGFHGFWVEGGGAAGGQAGEDIAANYTMSFDIKVEGYAVGDFLAEGNVSIYKADYEATNLVDLNNDGDMLDGFDIWRSNFSSNLGPSASGAGWLHVEWNFGAGSAPTADALITTPYFDDESTFAFQIYPYQNGGNWGIDADNVVNIDNVTLEFVSNPTTPGDFDEDGDVDGRDFLMWQRGESPNGTLGGPVSGLDLVDWQANYGGGGGPLAALAAVPEPGSLMLAGISLAFAFGRRRYS
jgi:hypothetical protein